MLSSDQRHRKRPLRRLRRTLHDGQFLRHLLQLGIGRVRDELQSLRFAGIPCRRDARMGRCSRYARIPRLHELWEFCRDYRLRFLRRALHTGLLSQFRPSLNRSASCRTTTLPVVRGGALSALSIVFRMPKCSWCFHGGSDHDWTAAPCTAPRCDCAVKHPNRLRGRCLVPGCPCSRYRPLTHLPKPLNRFIARARRWPKRRRSDDV